MLDPDTLKAMLASGCTAEQVVAIVLADQKADQERLLARRTYERERKRNYRAKSTIVSPGHCGTTGDNPSPLSPPSFPDKEKVSIPLKEINLSSPLNPPTPVKHNLVRFPEFWSWYPRKEAKKDAEKAWLQALSKGTNPDLMINGVSKYQFSADPNFVPLPASWLRGERWEDDRSNIINHPAKLTIKQKTFKYHMEIADALSRGEYDFGAASRPDGGEAQILPALAGPTNQNLSEAGITYHAGATGSSSDDDGTLF